MTAARDLLFLTVVGALLLWVGRAWCRLVLDEFRHKLFVARDELFLFAADGGIAFDHPAYLYMRENINGLIRFAERINFPMVVLLGAWFWSHGETATTLEAKRQRIAFTGLNRSQRATLVEYDQRVRLSVVTFLFQRSISFFLLSVVSIAFALCWTILQRLARYGLRWLIAAAQRAEARGFGKVVLATLTALPLFSRSLSVLGATVQVAEQQVAHAGLPLPM